VTRARTAAAVCAAVLAALALAAGYRLFGRDRNPVPTAHSSSLAAAAAAEPAPGFLYGRITTRGGAIYEGRLRFGGGEEAFWGDYFNGSKAHNPWAAQAPADRLPRERRPLRIFGIEMPRSIFGERDRPKALGRLFMARFGDIARIEGRGRQVRVTLKSGTVFDLDRFEASDFDDGVRVWDGRQGTVDLDSLQVRTIELLPTAAVRGAPQRLHGTVRTRRGDFTGYVQWDREKCVGADELQGRTAQGEVSLRFDAIRAIARRSRESLTVTLLDGRQIVMGAGEGGQGHRGVYVEDRRYGRVLVSWDGFERVDFSPGGSGPGYDEFPPGRPLRGSVTTRAGHRFAGRLVYDLDESETTETLDAPADGVDYTIPFGLVAAIAPSGRDPRARRATITLHGGEELALDRAGDLGEGNAGLLVFPDGRPGPEYVPWAEVGHVELDRPAAGYPPISAPSASSPAGRSGPPRP
jgi:hypothetical protein